MKKERANFGRAAVKYGARSTGIVEKFPGGPQNFQWSDKYWKDSTHYENARGQILPQEAVRDLVQYAKDYGITAGDVEMPYNREVAYLRTAARKSMMSLMTPMLSHRTAEYRIPGWLWYCISQIRFRQTGKQPMAIRNIRTHNFQCEK